MDPIEQMIAEGGNPTQQEPTQQQQQTPPAPDYAKLFADSQAQMAIQTEQINQLIAAQQAALSRQTQQPTQQQPDLYAKFDPETAAALKAVTDNITAKFNSELAARDSRLAELQAQATINRIAPNVPAAITNKATELYTSLQKKGIPVNLEETVDMLIGAAVRNGTYNPNQRTAAPTVLNGGSGMPQRGRPANFDSLAYKEQVKILEATGELDAEF